MIISQLFGGLGNQMFQYAAGRALAIARKTSLKLDVSRLFSESHHQGFQLPDIFRGDFDIATSSDVVNTIGPLRSYPKFQYFLSKPIARPLRGSNYIVEPCYQYWAGLRAVPTQSFLSGYWQSERYFSDIATLIREDFTFKIPLTDLNAEIADRISSGNSVSLHVRRGDYVSSQAAAAHHGLCSISYYQNAIGALLHKVGPAIVYIFSDDPKWVRENLMVKEPCVYVDHNQGPASYIDMQLMSMCKHHIIANSSFSWWGAWLNPDHSKTVVAPKKWFAKTIPTHDLLPANWIRI